MWERKRLTTFSKLATFFTRRSFYHTVFLLLTNLRASNNLRGGSSFAPPILQALALKQQLLFLFGFFIASVFVSGCIQTFTSASRHCRFHQPLRHSLLPAAAFHLLTSASPAVACHSVVYFAFLSPLSAS